MDDFKGYIRKGVSRSLYADIEEKINLMQLINKKGQVLTYQKCIDILKDKKI